MPAFKQNPQPPLFSEAPESICILRLSAIGDVCNAIAMVQAIQQQWPSTRITWIAGKVEAQLLATLEGVEVLSFDKKQGLKGMRQLWRALKGRRFCALLHLQTALRASVLSLGIKAKHRLGFDKLRSCDGQSLFINRPVPSPQAPHVLDGFMAFAYALGVDAKPVDWNIPIPQEAQDFACSLIGEGPSLVLAPAASFAYKNWHNEGYAELIKHAQSKGMQVILVGSPDPKEVAVGEAIVKLCDAPVQNLIAQTSLLQLLAVLEQASLVISPDTGPAHMAVACHTPVIGLYAHHDPQRVGPYTCLDYAVSRYRECIEEETGKRREDLPWKLRVKDPQAMQKITTDEVIAMFDRVCEEKMILP